MGLPSCKTGVRGGLGQLCSMGCVLSIRGRWDVTPILFGLTNGMCLLKPHLTARNLQISMSYWSALAGGLVAPFILFRPTN